MGALLGGLGIAPPVARPTEPEPTEAPSPLPAWVGQVCTPLAVVPTGHRPKGAAFSPDGAEIWVSLLGGPPSLAVHDAQTGRLLQTHTLGKAGAVEVLFSPDGQKLYASQMETARVYEVDVPRREVTRVLETGSNWTKVLEWSADRRTLFASNWNFDDVSELDLATGQLVRRLPTVKTPRGLYATPDGQALYVAGFGDGRIERITLATGAREAIYTSGRAMRHLVGDPTRNVLYANDMSRAAVVKIDLATHQATVLAKTDPNPNTMALSPDGTLLFVSNRGVNGPDGYMADGPTWGSVLVIDTETGAILDSLIGGDQATALALSPDGKKLVFSDFRDDTLRLYAIPDLATLRAAGWPRRELHKKELWKSVKPATSLPAPAAAP
jgi:DNA-binding beta-propeller fold protein YncE